jgi:hypothetical protein
MDIAREMKNPELALKATDSQSGMPRSYMRWISGMCVSSALHSSSLLLFIRSVSAHASPLRIVTISQLRSAQHTHTEDVCGRRESKSTFHARRDSSAGIIRIRCVELILICLGEAKNAKAAAGDLIAKV